jgi:hypothetical protein
MSDLPPKADIDERMLNVRFVPIADMRLVALPVYHDGGLTGAMPVRSSSLIRLGRGTRSRKVLRWCDPISGPGEY